MALLAYREADNLRELLPRIIRNMDGLGVPYEIEVVDGQETGDNTPSVCENYGAVYYNQTEPGFGGAFREAIQHAGREAFLILDSDGSHNPDYIPAMFRMFRNEHLDLVIGSRYVKGGKTHDSKTSILMSRLLNSCFRLFLGIPAKDISTDFRVYDTAQLKNVHLQNVNYDVLQEVLLKLMMNNSEFKIGEVPITFEKRLYGESKRRLLPFILSYLKTLVKLTALRISPSLYSK